MTLTPQFHWYLYLGLLTDSKYQRWRFYCVSNPIPFENVCNWQLFCVCLCVMFIGFTWVITWYYQQSDRICHYDKITIIKLWIISFNRNNHLRDDAQKYFHQSSPLRTVVGYWVWCEVWGWNIFHSKPERKIPNVGSVGSKILWSDKTCNPFETKNSRVPIFLSVINLSCLIRWAWIRQQVCVAFACDPGDSDQTTYISHK